MPRPQLQLSQQLKQEQILAPQQIQSLEILLAPLLELQMKISAEMVENPVLEIDPPGDGEAPADDLYEGAEDMPPEPAKAGDTDAQLDELIQLADSWQDHLPPWHAQPVHDSDADEKRRHYFDSITEEVSLQEQLLEQLRLADVSPRTRELAELIVGSIDDQGYLRSHLADLATAASAELAELEPALALVQSFEPPGIGARDLCECLLLQLERKGRGRSLTAKLVSRHLDDIARNRLPQIARDLSISLDRLRELIDEVRALNPYPGSGIAPEQTIFVVPEVTVEERDDRFVVVPNREHVPRLRLSPFYLQLLEDPNTPAETRDYIKEKFVSGKLLIRSLSQRESTILRIAEVIVDSQYDFLRHGIEHLRPLTMQQVADKLGIHETTVSRAIAGKYMQTPVGLYEFKFFFTSGFHADDGDEVSSRGVMEKIRDLVARENLAHPLSDLKLAQLLREQGLPVARRTVAKYREEMGIPSSHLRREFS